MRTTLLLAMLALFLTASIPLFAAQAVGTSVTPPPFSPQAPKDPFKNLFAGQVKPNPKTDPKGDPKSPSPQQLLEQAREQLRARLSALMPTVKCGMTLVPTDPKMDSAIRLRVPEGGTKFVMQIVPPSVCR